MSSADDLFAELFEPGSAKSSRFKPKAGKVDYERALWKFCDNVRDGLDSDDEQEREISAGDRELLHELGLWRGPEAPEFEQPGPTCSQCGSQRTAVEHWKDGARGRGRQVRYGCRTCDHFWTVTEASALCPNCGQRHGSDGPECIAAR